MSVQVITPTFQLISASPVIISAGSNLLAYQTSGRISTLSSVNSGFSQQNPTWWSFYYNVPVQNVSTGAIERLELYH